jgi:hypothetical protein
MINDETQAFQFQTKDNYLKSTLLNDRFRVFFFLILHIVVHCLVTFSIYLCG